jgi:ZIP family zinc transporter
MSPIAIMLIPAIVVALSGVLTLIWHPSHQARSLIQHFAAGVVIAVLAVEVLPELTREHAPNWVLIASFAFGVFLMYVMKIWSEHLEHKAKLSGTEGANVGLISTVFIDAAVDGLIIGAGFAASKETGFVLAIGLSVEMLFLGLSLVSNTMKGWRIVALTTLLGVDMIASILLGNYFLTGASPSVISAILSFGVAALLYLVTEELLIEAHTVEEKPTSVLWLFSGFLLFWTFQLYTAH